MLVVSNLIVMPSIRQCARSLFARKVACLALVLLAIPVVVIVLRAESARADAEQYRVFSDYLEQGLTGESHSLGSRRGLVVIDGSSRGCFRRDLMLITRFSAVRRDLQLNSKTPLINYLLTNLFSEQFQKSFALSARYELMTAAESKLYPHEPFQKRFPNNYGYHSFTRVGFNRAMTEAVFYTEHFCGMCGEGKYVYMQKRGERWIVVQEAMTWIS